MALPHWGGWLLSVTAAAALLLAYNQWQRLNRVQEQLATQSAATQTQAIEARTLSQQAQSLAQEAATRASLSEARINEYTLQRSHLEQMAFELSRTRDEAMLIDIEASLRLAQQQAQLTGLADPLIAALRNARQRVERTDQARLASVLAAIDRDLARLTGTAVTDTAGLLGRIDNLLLQLEQMPLANSVGRPITAPSLPTELGDDATQALAAGTDPTEPTTADDAAQAAENTNNAIAATTASAEGTNVAADPPSTASPAQPADDGDAGPSGGLQSRFWSGIRDSFHGLVRVQRIDHPEAALLTQEQTFFLRENIRLQLMNARMGLLARQTASARADLASVQALVLRYYDLNAPRTRHALRTLQQLQDHILSVQPPAITETLSAITASYSAREGPARTPAPTEGGTAADASSTDANPAEPEVAASRQEPR